MDVDPVEVVHGLFDYNRDNYFYDRKMRQKQEFKVMSYRNKQASLWRDDVRDIIELTVGKMETYTIVNVLELTFCIELIAAGRMEPGTPQWLLYLYMLSLSASFVYLLIAAWLAMHASVAAQAGGTRLLTQLVRLPVPSWDQLEGVRTYGNTFEQVKSRHIMRVPFLDKLMPKSSKMTKPGVSQGKGIGLLQKKIVDPWSLEQNGADIYELQHRPVGTRRHIKLVRNAAVGWQAHDGFTRVSMTLGTVHLLYAVCYWCLGNVMVENGEPWGAIFITLILSGGALMLLYLDLSLSSTESHIIQILNFGGPGFSCFAAISWSRYTEEGTWLADLALPFGFAAHGLLLAYILWIADVVKQANGTMLPLRWRAVLYVDVFGWLFNNLADKQSGINVGDQAGMRPRMVSIHDGEVEELPESRNAPSTVVNARDPLALDAMEDELRADMMLWSRADVFSILIEEDKARVQRCREHLEDLSVQSTSVRGFKRMHQMPPKAQASPMKWLYVRELTGQGAENWFLYNPRTSEKINSDASEATSFGLTPLTLAETEEQLDLFKAELQNGSDGPTNQFAQVRTSTVPESQGMQGSPRHSSGRSSWRAEFGDPMNDAQSPSSAGDVQTLGPARPEDARLGAKQCPNKADQIARKQSRMALEQSDMEVGNKRVEGVGPCAAVPACTKQDFEADTFYPYSGTSISDKKEVSVTGHDLARGRAPWILVRSMTRILAGAYAVGTVWCVGRLVNAPDFKNRPLPAVAEMLFNKTEPPSVMQELLIRSINGLPPPARADPTEPRPHTLEGGEQIPTAWPHSARFVPRTLSCDAQGKQFVVADQLGVYTARLRPTSTNASGTAANAAQGLRRALRAAITAPVLAEEAHFERAPACPSLEGQVPQDASVVCRDEGQATLARRSCSAVVLHNEADDGAVTLSECPLEENRTSDPISWHIATDWLEREQDTGQSKGADETVTVLAVSDDCVAKAGDAESESFPDMRICAVVGTSKGRLVQLRKHVADTSELVPISATRLKKGEPGSTHILAGGHVVLLRSLGGSGRKKSRTRRKDTPTAVSTAVEAIDPVEGRVVQQWLLPQGLRWLGLCAGGGDLFVLGQAHHEASSLWRFPLPEELKKSGLRDQVDTDTIPLASA